MTNFCLTEAENTKTQNIDLANSLEIVKMMNQEDQKVALAIEKILPEIAQVVDVMVESVKNGGRIAYFGAGTSGRIGILDASECPPTFNAPKTMIQAFIAGGNKAIKNAVENAEDNASFGKKDLKKFSPTPKDIIIGISASGNPQYLLSILKQARKLGCTTVALTSNPDAKIKEYATYFLNPILGPEVISGSSRLKSGTAQKMILNMLSTATMIRLGKTYQNKMIDLKISNQKLYSRACRIISNITKSSKNQAQSALKKAKNNLRIASVMLIKKCSYAKAQKLLKENNGILRKIID